MITRLPLCLFGLVGFLMAGSVLAQPPDRGDANPSHVPIPSSVSDPKLLQEMLAARLRRAQDMADIQKLLSDPAMLDMARELLKDPDKFGLKDQIDKIKSQKPNLDDPAWRDLLDKIADPNAPESKLLPPDKRDTLKKLLDRNPNPNPDRPSPRPPDAARPMPMPPVKPPDGNGPPMNTEPVPPVQPPPPRPPQDNKAQAEKFKWMADLAKKARDSKWSMKDSPAWRQFVRDLGQTVAGADKEQGFGLSDQAAEWAGKFPALRDLVSPDQLPRPDWSKMNGSWFDRLNDVKWSSGGPAGGGAWGAPSVDAGPGAGTWIALLWLVLGVGVVIAAVLMLRWNKDRQAASQPPGWRLGPWPVDPKTLRTREEVVKAFEYVSLLRLGPSARSWHHRRIADSLPGPDPDAVARAAAVYEKARYTPPKEPLTEADLAAARRDLSDLAGVS